MNPGPWGMAQTGVPFGSVPYARDWLAVKGEIGEPSRQHPKRPVLGWGCSRVEVSGRRLWSLLESIYGSARKMAREMVVLNYCPLLLLRANGDRCRNLPIDKVRSAGELTECCDENLDAVLSAMQPEVAIGVGAWATSKLERVAPPGMVVGRMLHPSPASPLANRMFEEAARTVLSEHGVHL